MGHRHVWQAVVILLAAVVVHAHAADAVSPAKMKVAAALAKVRYGDVFSARTALDIVEAKLDQKKLMELIDERWRSVPADVTSPANYQVRCKLSWILGLIKSPEAAERLRGYIAEDSHGIVLASGLHALSQFPLAKENADLARAIKVKLGDRVNEKVSDHGSYGFSIQWTLSQEIERFLAAYDKTENATKPGKVVVEPATFHCLSFQWPIEGDDNRNCAVAVAYRKKAAKEWKDAMPLLRVENRPHLKKGVYAGNILAGSIFNLSPGKTYEVRLQLIDPDGGQAERLLAVRTRSVPRDSVGGRMLHVVPGAGGGTGTRADPFKGIAVADAAAKPGDILLLGKGVYQGRTTLTKDGTLANTVGWQLVGADLPRGDVRNIIAHIAITIRRSLLRK